MCFRVFFFPHVKTNIAINHDAMTDSGLRCTQYTATGPAHIKPTDDRSDLDNAKQNTERHNPDIT
jgi:hypothetical protein